MSAFDNVVEGIERKKAGMLLLCTSISQNLESEAKNNASWKDRTGNARQGITGRATNHRNGSVFRIILSHSVDYGEILEEGSPPHIIRARNKKFLYWKGAQHPVKQVNHPGTKGKPTLEPTIENNIDDIKKHILDYWSD